jgi:ribose/xylose/arabinose/galactoside ABC-type transport system permease subunit
MAGNPEMPVKTQAPPDVAAPDADGRSRGGAAAALRDHAVGTAGPALAFLIVAVIFTFGTDQFLNTDNVTLILDQTAPVTIAACAMTMVILMGGIDLSVGSILSLAGVLAAVSLRDGRGIVVAIALALLAGAAVGLLNGLVTVRWAVQPFLVTLGTLSIARGLAELTADGATVPILSDPFDNLFAAKIGAIPVSVLWTLAVLAGSHVLLRHTVFGRRVYMIGGNEQSAIQAGVRVKRVKVVVYVLSGVLAALAGLLVASRLSSGLPGSGVGFELNVIAAVVLGGTGFRGEGGSIIGTLFGGLTIGAVSNGLTLMEVDPFVQKAITGAIIIGAVVLGSMREKSRR